MTFPEFTEVYPEVAELVPMTILERYTLPENICKKFAWVFDYPVIQRLKTVAFVFDNSKTNLCCARVDSDNHAAIFSITASGMSKLA